MPSANVAGWRMMGELSEGIAVLPTPGAPVTSRGRLASSAERAASSSAAARPARTDSGRRRTGVARDESLRSPPVTRREPARHTDHRSPGHSGRRLPARRSRRTPERVRIAAAVPEGDRVRPGSAGVSGSVRWLHLSAEGKGSTEVFRHPYGIPSPLAHGHPFGRREDEAPDAARSQSSGFHDARIKPSVE